MAGTYYPMKGKGKGTREGRGRGKLWANNYSEIEGGRKGKSRSGAHF